MEPNKNRSNANNKIIVFGEILADVYPEYALLGGAPFNVARHLKAFGLNPILISRVGDDSLGEVIAMEMSEREMDMSAVQQDSAYPSGQVKVTLKNGLPEYEILADQAYDFIHVDPDFVSSIAAEILYFGTLAQRNSQSGEALNELLARDYETKFLDLNLRQPWYSKKIIESSLTHADIVKINEEELKVVCEYFGLKHTNSHIQGLNLINYFQIKQLLVTTGASGSWSIHNHELYLTEPTKPINPILDTVGAGDAFSAAFIYGYINRWGMSLTLLRANQFASAICGIRGAVPESLDFYNPFIADWQ